MSGEPETHKLDTQELMKFIDQLTQEIADEQRVQLAAVAGELSHARGSVAGFGRQPHLLHPASRKPRADERTAAERNVHSRTRVLASDLTPDARVEVDERRSFAPPLGSALPRVLALVAVALLTCGLLSWVCAFPTHARSARASGPPPLPNIRRADESAGTPHPNEGQGSPLTTEVVEPLTLRDRSEPAAWLSATPRHAGVEAPARATKQQHALHEPAAESEASRRESRARAARIVDGLRTAAAALERAHPPPVNASPFGRAHVGSGAVDLPDTARASVRRERPHPLRREAVDLLLAGRTRAALDRYRALRLAGDQPELLGDIVRMLEQELRACEQQGASACGR